MAVEQFLAYAANLTVFSVGLLLIMYLPGSIKAIGILAVVYSGGNLLFEFIDGIIPLPISLGIASGQAGAFLVFALVGIYLMTFLFKSK